MLQPTNVVLSLYVHIDSFLSYEAEIMNTLLADFYNCRVRENTLQHHNPQQFSEIEFKSLFTLTNFRRLVPAMHVDRKVLS